MYRISFVSLLLLPAFAFAGEAGFPAQSIWVSHASLTEGETVVISTVVHNGTAEGLEGTIIFNAESARIGAREFELPPGTSQIHSIEWKPKAGEYRVSAAIEGTSADLTQRESPTVLVAVAKPPEPSAVEAAVSGAAGAAGKIASSTIPIVKQVANGIFNTIEPYREGAVERLSDYVARKEERVPSGTVAGTTTAVSGFSSSSANSESAASGATRMAAAAALFVVGNLYLFYPVLALFVLGTLYFLAKRVRRKPDA